MEKIAVLMAVLLATPAMACNEEILTVTEWEVAETEGFLSSSFIGLGITHLNNSDRTIRMVQGRTEFHDILDRRIASVPMAEDELRRPGEQTLQVTVAGRPGSDRLETASPDDIVVSTCVNAVVYDDGTVERFD